MSSRKKKGVRIISERNRERDRERYVENNFKKIDECRKYD